MSHSFVFLDYSLIILDFLKTQKYMEILHISMYLIYLFITYIYQFVDYNIGLTFLGIFEGTVIFASLEKKKEYVQNITKQNNIYMKSQIILYMAMFII